MANNKYIGHNGQLIGPVTVEKPAFDYDFPPDGPSNNMLADAQADFEERINIYEQHLSTLPRIPCEGWVPEAGRQYVEGVDFTKQHQYYSGGYWCNCGLDFFIAFNLHANSSFGRIVAFPAVSSVPADYELNPEEGTAYLQSTDAVTADNGAGNIRVVFPEYNASATVAHDCPQEVLDALKTVCELAFKSAAPLPAGERAKNDNTGAPEATVGDFIMDNAKGVQLNDGTYYHYSQVCLLLKKWDQKYALTPTDPTYPAEFVEWAAIRGWKCYTIDGKNVWVNSLINENHKTTPELYIFYQQSKSNTDAK